ncbi:MAG: YkgJ family cysteine cluster protein [Candidatus Latescibacterota bacterium]
MRCRRCGTCCQVDFSALAQPDDVSRWQAQGRRDILHLLGEGGPAWMGDRLVWPEDGREMTACRFLARQGSRWACRIHATRPGVCRRFRPGSSPLCPLYAHGQSPGCAAA